MAYPGSRGGLKLAKALLDSGVHSWRSNAGSGLEQIAPFGARMASNQAVKNRMRSVQSIQKITKAMKMVAASKLRGVQKKCEDSRPIWQPFTALLGDDPDVAGQKNLTIVITSDRGLCGGINTTAVKFGRAIHRLLSLDEGKDHRFVIIGEKGRAQLVRDMKTHIATSITETQKYPINFTQICMIADEILKNTEFDVIRLIYNRFNSVVSFVPTLSTVVAPEVLSEEEPGEGTSLLDQYELEDAETKSELMQNLSEFQLASVLYNASLENACSEQGARMSAMDNSSRNASEMLEKLTLSYNRSRQATITTELIEIISGAAALEAS